MIVGEPALQEAVGDFRAATDSLARAIYAVRNFPRSQLDVLTDFELEVLFRNSVRVPLTTRCIAASELVRRLAARSEPRGLPFRVLEDLLETLDPGRDPERTDALERLAAGFHDFSAILQLDVRERVPRLGR